MLKHPIESLAPLPYMGIYLVNLWDFMGNLKDFRDFVQIL